ncbi:hypothetical protein BKG91_10810 [Rodentibacter caecimuris]|uniref:hypothetical protein n=1 Tax=Rodentibacter TaxID=1960084 RepID=UPI0007511AA8|nr:MULTISPECIES: hypothetical protein [Rodentibacter]AOF54024.1 hypothetical protein AC062_1935 [Pasteurellaceae bacterium NI1060]MDC2826681.1 hypothetical protein [Rodentibacter pneumotropicus]OOF61533.1 hypothetical protein BKL51_10625 [Rodentibacter sp. Ppn85]OOF72398.1 hypothetical protein BKG91_10810 [Rodentibacter heylii]
MWKIYKGNDQDLSFALDCLYCQAINLEEFKLWIYRIIETSSVDEVPVYFYDLLDFDDSLFKLSKVIGFSVKSYLSCEGEYSIYGISYIRGIDVFDSPVNKLEAISYLKLNEEILSKFKFFFPFIYIEEF